MIFVHYGRIDVRDGAFVVINDVDGQDQERKHIPVGSVACIMLEPGTRISHPAVGGGDRYLVDLGRRGRGAAIFCGPTWRGAVG